jgi:carbon-monoxide dehydrogenase large subunit
MAADWLGLEPGRIRFVQGDTDKVAFGGGTYASRSMVAGGTALRRAADGIIAKAKVMAAHILEADADEIAFEDGRFSLARTNRWVSLPEVAAASHAADDWPAELGAGLEAVGAFTHEARNYPSGCHVAEVEVDPETGAVEVVRFTAVDDVGRTADEILMAGQTHGAIAQGLGQALMESVVHDASGQLLTGSFLDYALPRAADLPAITTATRNVPSPTNPLGMKGGGELGTVGAPPAILAAIADALRPLGVGEIDLPATPQRVWQAIRDAAAAQAQ